MKILICNERFLFRFGVDRVLLLLAKYFKEMGHTIIFMGNKMDKEAVGPFADEIIYIPESPDYLNSNEFTLQWLQDNWNSYFMNESKPDIALVAGWPFYSSIGFFKSVCKSVVFNDYGAVPLEGFDNGATIVQKKLRDLRKQNIKEANSVIAISDFIKNTQSIADTKDNIPCETILLGANHMELGLWTKENLELKSGELITKVKELKQENRKIIFLLGRWEDNYKNSPASFEILRKIKNEYPGAILLALANEEVKNSIPRDLKESIKLLGFVDDQDLQDLMRMSDIGICPTLWEGFNLPLAEMQMLEKPIFVLNKGAHPEVVFHPWYMCESVEEMSEKMLVELSDKKQVSDEEKYIAYKKFKKYFTWERCAKAYIDHFTQLVYKDCTIMIDVTNACHDTANSGVMRVTRRISQEIQQRVNTIFVLWDDSVNQYVFPTESEINLLSAYNGPLKEKIIYISPDNARKTLDSVMYSLEFENITMLFTETINEKKAIKIRPYLRKLNIKLGAIFYDAIPIIHPEYCNTEVTNNHAEYMKGLGQCDVVVPISECSKQGLIEFWESNNVEKINVETNLLPGELEGIERNTKVEISEHKRVKILCVSTLEPRKNHKTLLNACLRISEIYKELDYELILVGNRYAGNDEIPNHVNEICSKNKNIKWLGVVNDMELIKLYRECSFTIYPSIIEGFGMPIVESVWNGRPCICSNQGAMGEIANDGGCLTVNVEEEDELVSAIYKLSTDVKLRESLQNEAINRYMKTWDDYIVSLLNIIYSNTKPEKLVKSSNDIIWQDILYKGIGSNKGCMNEAEKIGLIGMLERHKPNCSIQIGRGENECIELIAQTTNIGFVIQEKENVKIKDVDNITSLIGKTNLVMPILMQELNSNSMSIDFVLIDGTTALEDIEYIFNLLQNYKPKEPMFVVIYNSFNPKCREQIMKINLNKIKYLQWIDLDFIKGNMREEKNNTLMYGGLAMAYFSSKERKSEIIINQS